MKISRILVRILFLIGVTLIVFGFFPKIIIISPEAKFKIEILGFLALIIAVVTEIHLHRVGKEIKKVTEKADLALKNIERIEKHFGIPIYPDGLPSADPPVFDPFLEGTKLMTQYKWDEAIAEFQKAMKEAKATQLVALYNLVAICYYTSGRLSLALDNYNESLRLARQFNDKEGEGGALGNVGLIYQDKGDLDKALKYYQEALKIHKEIGFREGEANALGNIGLIYKAKGDLEQALKYYQGALKIHKEIGFRQSEASDLGNI
ncbi:MAG: hypothetical protein AMJ89_02200, partial [candidate division Zixibacteria bacterium SM23_73]